LKSKILIEIKAAEVLIYKASREWPIGIRHGARADGEEESAMYKHILIPTDGSELSKKAIQHGVALAKAVNAKITAITVSTPFHTMTVEPGMVSDTPESYAKRIIEITTKYLDVVKSAAATSGVTCVVHVEHDHPYQAIINAAKNNGCDLVVMASHGRRGVSAIVLGSETIKVLTHSTIPVLVYR
jgi:nucleotide-binding universal stress UspA family protein